MVDSRTLPEDGVLSIILAESGNFLRWMVISAGLFIVLIASNYKNRIKTLHTHFSLFRFFLTVTVHLIIFISLVISSFQVFINDQEIVKYYSIWITLVVITLVSWSLIITRLNSWGKFIIAEKKSILVAILVGFLVLVSGFYFQQFWGSMTELTFGATQFLLEIFYDDIFVDIPQSKLGINKFWVHIAPICSGIEGAVIAVSVAALYLYFSKEHLKIPHAFILLPIAAIISIFLNIIRITLLIILGEEISPALAIGGFHSVAGWISAVLVSLLIVFVFSHWSWIQKVTLNNQSYTQQTLDSKLAQAILIPFVIFAVMTLFGKIFDDGFDYFYPVKIIITLGVVIYFWKYYQLKAPDKIVIPVIAGIIVAILWFLLVPVNEQVNTSFTDTISSMPLELLFIWGFFRLIGFLILIPVLEELVFRSYIISRLSGQNLNNNQKPDFNILAILLSSLLFGFIHDAWIAGTIAGFIFAYVRYQSESITSCITAHGVANALVFCIAAFTGNWSLV